MSLSGKIKHAGKWQSFSVLSLSVLQILYFSVMTRILLKEDYGLMAIINAIIGVGNIFIQGGMGSALIQKKEINNRHINGALQTSMLLAVILYAIFYITAPYIASVYNDLRLDHLIKVSSLNIILLALSNISVNLLFKYYHFKNAAIVQIIASIIGYGTGIYLAMNDYGVWSLVIATLITSLLSAIAMFYLAPIKISLNVHYKEARELFGFGSGMMLLTFSNFLSNRGLNLIFGKIFAQDILGIYERTSRVKDIPSQFLAKIINQVMFPVMSEIQDEKERSIRIYKFGLGLSNSIMIPTTVLLVFFSAEIVQILMGTKWSEAVTPLQIMLLVLTFSNSGKMTDTVIRAQGLIYKNVTRKYIFVVIILVLSGALGYLYGINGAAIGIVISHFINYVMMIVLVKNVFKGTIKEYFFKPFIAGLKLGIYLGVLIFGYNHLFNLWGKTDVIMFIVFMAVLLLLCAILVKFKPTVFGEYLETTIRNTLNIR
ncbi:lipopolysaccharide biosynthesis protein [Croceitalea sp. MTPC5]|uniref:lipopolysaccharide biosynthesis protein n=1 Tax=Croceitalea sp. MTPC5 TaxID=3056565 RepID=UPI002B373257|nr:lipopolysaccharide biosynthesis protein [Croceitalea sp. MTPC5]